MLCNPVTEQFRLEYNGKYVGVVTIAYPSKSTAILLGWVGIAPPTKSQIKSIVGHIRSTGRTELIFYRVKRGKEIKKRYKL